MFCRKCGKEIEAGARFCRFCGASQQEAQGSGRGSRANPSALNRFERWRRHLFPRHHLQDEFMELANMGAALVALIGFLMTLFGNPQGEPLILFAIALLLFLMVRESTLAHIRGEGSHRPGGEAPSSPRYHAARTSQATEATRHEAPGGDSAPQ